MNKILKSAIGSGVALLSLALVANPAAADVAPSHPESTQQAPAEYKRYLLNNTYHGHWSDDGVKGQVRNFTSKRIIVRDTVMDKTVDIWPGQTVVFYSDRDLRSFGDLDEGDGTWLEIGEYGSNLPRSEFRLCDAWMGRPDTSFFGPGRRIHNTRAGWSVGESHHELTPTHKFWVKREADSWKDKYDTWDTGDWAAFSIHVDAI